jgi:hypothetical protein
MIFLAGSRSTNPKVHDSLDCHTHTSVMLRHWDEHVMVICKVLICGVLKMHMRQYAKGQSSEAQMQLAESQATERLVSDSLTKQEN